MVEKDKGLVIIGAGGHGRVSAEIAVKMGKWKQICFLDDDDAAGLSTDIEIVGKTGDAVNYITEYEMFIAVGDNKTREKLQSMLEDSGARIAVLIHPGAIISEKAELGVGTVLMAGAIVNCGSKIGKGCIINTGATVDHDNIIEDYVHISPGTNLAGNVKIGKGTWIGIGSAVSNNVTIIGGCTIGAGAVVVKSILDAGTYAGVPARKIK